MEENNDAVFLKDGYEPHSEEALIAKEEELLDAWLDSLRGAEGDSPLAEAVSGGIPIGGGARLKVRGRNLNDGPDMATVDARPKPAVEVGVSFSF